MRTINQYRALQHRAMETLRNSTDPRDIENYELIRSESAAEGVRIPARRESVVVNTGRYAVEFVNPLTGQTHRKGFVAASVRSAKTKSLEVLRELAAEVRASGIDLPRVQTYNIIKETRRVSI